MTHVVLQNHGYLLLKLFYSYLASRDIRLDYSRSSGSSLAQGTSRRPPASASVNACPDHSSDERVNDLPPAGSIAFPIAREVIERRMFDGVAFMFAIGGAAASWPVTWSRRPSRWEHLAATSVETVNHRLVDEPQEAPDRPTIDGG